MNIFRIHIKPKGGDANPSFAFNYCIKENVLGLGWQTNSGESGISWTDYEKEAAEIYGNNELSRIRYLKDNLNPGDLIWTRDTKGCYYLAKILSQWEYFTNKRAQKADIVNVVRCDIRKINSIDDVPGKVIASFRPTRSIQAIRDGNILEYSKYLWNKITNSKEYLVEFNNIDNLFSLLNSEEIEDVIFIYLQLNGWIVIPNSRKVDTMAYEYYAINKSSNEKGLVQVKTGNTAINIRSYGRYKEKIILFQSNGLYKGDRIKNVICLEPNTIEKFIRKNEKFLPSNILNWLKIFDDEGKNNEQL